MWGKRTDICCYSALTILVLTIMPVHAQPAIIVDPAGDAVIRRTDQGNNGYINPNTQRLADILEMNLGKFSPIDPQQNLFAGDWDENGGFFRFDLVVAGLINPPGPLAFADEYPVYAPFFYGPNPITGFIEFDVDVDENTGGEVGAPNFRYLGNVGRFGGAPREARFFGRFALDATAFDENILTPPYIEKSGEEFHIAFLGEEIESIDVRLEKSGGNPAIFEAGEVWWVKGTLFHREHGVEEFLLECDYRKGLYKPQSIIQFAHDLQADRTTISLVYPLTNTFSAAMSGPDTPVESDDGCDDDQNSILEALGDLQFSAENASNSDILDPNFQLLAGWDVKTPGDFLNPANWRVAALVGTCYGVQQGNARFIWTDIWPNVRLGDFDGNCSLDAAEHTEMTTYITVHDGLDDFDDDETHNGKVKLHNFAQRFSIYDTNYDGTVQADDALVGGDMDLNQALNVHDVDDFVQALLDASAYENSHYGVDPVLRGDMNCDGVLDGADIAGFIDKVLNP